jgi:flagellar basal body-associated protein FliL
MLKNKKLIVALAVVLVGGGAAYSMAAPKPVAIKKIKGTVYVLPQPFLLNLNDGHYAKISLGLLLAPGQSDGAAAGASSGGSESAGTLPEEAVIRDIVTNLLTNSSSGELLSDGGRHSVKRAILAAIGRQTDVKVEGVLFPELTVQ